MEKNKLSTTLKIMKIITLVISVLVFSFFLYLTISVKIDIMQSTGNGAEGLGYAIVLVLALVYGAIFDGFLALFSFAWLITSIVSKNKIEKLEDAEMSEEKQKLLAVRKKDIKHFILLTILPIVIYFVNIILIMTII